MDPSDFGWISKVGEHLGPLLDALRAVSLSIGQWLADLQARYPQVFSPQTLFGLIATILAIWRWWEAREANLFRRFEEMIAREEAQLVKARNDLLDVMNRPGPGIRIQPPLFVDKSLRLVLTRRRWHPGSLMSVGQKLDRRLESAVETSNRKVAAHEARLSFFRREIASARLVQGALAGCRAARSSELHEKQLFQQEALDRFSSVLTLPGHENDPTALELVAHQLKEIDSRSVATINAYSAAITTLENPPPSAMRNSALARVKRSFAILRYPAAPRIANDHLVEATFLLTQLGPRRDRDLLELAEALRLEGITRFRLDHGVLGPQRLREARGHYRDLLRSLGARRKGLFHWMFRTRLYAGHRVRELRRQAALGLAEVEHLIKLTDRYPQTITANLQRGHGVRRRNRRPLPMPKGH
jgi:hypothetical protein